MIARWLARWTGTGVSLAAFVFLSANALAVECFDLIPKDANPDGELWLCESAHSGAPQVYGCQDYVSDEGRYRLYFRGGAEPKAVAAIARDNSVIWHQTTWFAPTAQRACEIAMPVGVPDAATHLGTGVCRDSCGKPVPCSVFRLEAAREMDIVHFTVLYHPDGLGPSAMDTRRMGRHDEAMIAELSYQLGVSLMHADCCFEQALGYLAHAHKLFPNDGQYRESYLRMRALHRPDTR